MFKTHFKENMELAELCVNGEANHTCAKFSIFFLSVRCFFMLMKVYVIVFLNFLLKYKIKKSKMILPLSVVYTAGAKPNDAGLFHSPISFTKPPLIQELGSPAAAIPCLKVL